MPECDLLWRASSSEREKRQPQPKQCTKQKFCYIKFSLWQLKFKFRVAKFTNSSSATKSSVSDKKGSYGTKKFQVLIRNGKVLDGKVLDGKILEGKVLGGKVLDGKVLGVPDQVHANGFSPVWRLRCAFKCDDFA